MTDLFPLFPSPKLSSQHHHEKHAVTLADQPHLQIFIDLLSDPACRRLLPVPVRTGYPKISSRRRQLPTVSMFRVPVENKRHKVFEKYCSIRLFAKVLQNFSVVSNREKRRHCTIVHLNTFTFTLFLAFESVNIFRTPYGYYNGYSFM